MIQNFITPDLSPADSADLNPVDFTGYAVIHENVFQKQRGMSNVVHHHRHHMKIYSALITYSSHKCSTKVT